MTSVRPARWQTQRFGLLIGAGLVAGSLLAVCFYIPALNAAAHLAGPWVALGVLAGRAATWPRSIGRSAAALLAGMVGFYIARWVAYRVKWGGWLESLLSETWTWTLLGGLAGVVLGSLGYWMLSTRAAVSLWSSGAVIALLAGDALVYWHHRGPTVPVMAGVVMNLILALVILRVVSPGHRVLAIAAASVLLVPAVTAVVGLEIV